jgi:hypothetical protein
MVRGHHFQHLLQVYTDFPNALLYIYIYRERGWGFNLKNSLIIKLSEFSSVIVLETKLILCVVYGTILTYEFRFKKLETGSWRMKYNKNCIFKLIIAPKTYTLVHIRYEKTPSTQTHTYIYTLNIYIIIYTCVCVKVWGEYYGLENSSDLLSFTYKLSVNNQLLGIRQCTRMHFIGISVSWKEMANG